MKFFLICALTFGAAWSTLSVVRAFGWPYWTFYALAIVAGVVLYVINNLLIVGYIRRGSPGIASKEEVAPGVQAWELTAGTGIVPKWVSFIGIASIGFFLACPFELAAWALRALQK